MSDHDQDQKTEEATTKQKEKFREKGEVARSQDLAAVIAIISGAGAIVFAWSTIGGGLSILAVRMLGHLELHGREVAYGAIAFKTIAVVIAPVSIAVMVLGIAGQISQVGWKPSFKAMAPDIKKFNPLPQFKKLFFSGSTVIELLKSLVKVVVIGSLAVTVLWEEVSNNGRLIALTPPEVMVRLGEISLRIILTVIVALAFIAVVDIMIERFRHSRKMKMTKDEVKREHKDDDGDPMLKARIRGKQREMAKMRMVEDVSKADVVVVNPTHYSVALRYNMAVDSAPMILASGVDDMAAKIRKKARDHNVPIVSDPPLARALYAQGKPGKAIPAEMFRAVASLLAWVYSTTGRMS